MESEEEFSDYKVFFSKLYAKILYNQDLCIIVSQPYLFFSDEKAKEYIAKMMECIEKFDLNKIMYDMREVKVFKEEDREYVKATFYPFIEARGIKYIAYIYPQYVFGQVALNEIKQYITTHHQFIVEKFDSFEDAQEWLISQT